jgi:FAD synthetase
MVIVKRPKAKRVMVFGTFDIIHPGHLNYILQASKYAKEVIAVVARDVNVKKQKGKKPKYSEAKRLVKVSLIPGVSLAVIGDKKEKYNVLDEYRPDFLCLGYDLEIKISDLRKELKKRKLKTKIIRAKSYKPEVYKSSKIKKQLYLPSSFRSRK